MDSITTGTYGPRLATLKVVTLPGIGQPILCEGSALSSASHWHILDAELIRDATSTLAETLKLARPHIPILLLDDRGDPNRKDRLPKGVDGAMSGRFPAEVWRALPPSLEKCRTILVSEQIPLFGLRVKQWVVLV